jgi:N-ethylmaleimide reductase
MEVSMATESILFSPLTLGPNILKNRIVMAPMTRNRAAEGSVVTPLHAEYYSQRASAGLLITCATQVSPAGVGYPATPGIHTSEQVEAWKMVTEAVHAGGGKIFLQLWHVGRISHPSLQPDGQLPVAPSAIRPAGQAFTYEGMLDFVTPRALEIGEIPGVVDEYRKGAENALAAGFDGVEIHGANGYLIDQFLRDGSNHRTDEYGGSLENRARFLLEVVEAVTGVWGSDRVGVRISPLNAFNDMHDSAPQALFNHVSDALSGRGLAYLHVVEGIMDANAPEDQQFDFSQVKQAFRGPYIANGGYDRERADAVLTLGRADLVAFGVLSLANPDLPERLLKAGPFNAPDQDTFYGGGAKGYTDYPFLD